MEPKVNIIIANYNYSKWISSAIDSALGQTYKNIVISVIDDCSTDNSVDIALKKLNINKENVVKQEDCDLWINEQGHQVIALHKNSGPSVARNKAIDLNLSDCTFFTLLDSDDMIMPSKVEKLVNEILKFQGVGCIYADYFILNVETNEQKYEYKRTYSGMKLLGECIVHSGCMFTKDSLLAAKDEYGFFDPRIRGPEDYDLWIRMAEKATIMHYAEPLTIVRYTGNNISNTKNEANKINYANGFQLINHKITARNNGKATASR